MAIRSATQRPGSVAAANAQRPLAVALDIGSSSLRASLYDAVGRRVAGTGVRRRYAWEVTDDGGFSISPDWLLDEIALLLDALVEASGALVGEAVAVGISCFFHSLAGLDADDRPITPLLAWADTRPAAEADALAEILDAEAVRQRTGTPLHASYWPAKIRYLRRTDARVARWAGLPGLLAARLSGRRGIGVSIAAGTGLLDRRSRDWDAELLGTLDLDRSSLPALLGDDEPMAIADEARRRWPTLARLAWFPVWGDGACGNVGLDCNGARKAALMIGTSGALRVITEASLPVIPEGLFGFAFGGDRLLLGGQASEGGAVLAWLSGLLNRPAGDLDQAAAALQPIGGRLAVLPYAAGERSPGFHPEARAVIDGLRLATDPVEVYRAFQEAIAYGFAALDERLSAALSEPPQLVAAGGALERSAGLPQVMADVIGRDLDLSLTGEPSSRGAAILALRAAGAKLELAPLPVRHVTADAANASVYASGRERHRALYRLLDA